MSNDKETSATSGSQGWEEPTRPEGDDQATMLPPVATGGGNVPEAIQKAWEAYMVKGFLQNEEMFKRTLAAYMQPYYLTMAMYVVLFLVGIGLFVAAVVIGLSKGEPVVAIVFGGLSVGVFLAFFIRQPIQAMEENLEFITWLGVAFNTYWTRLMYLMDTKTIQQELKAAEDDYTKAITRIINRHATLRAKHAGPDQGSGSAQNTEASEKK